MNLNDFFKEHKKAAIAFSGGVDSAYLLSMAVKYGEDIRAFFVKSQFQPEFELDDARRLAGLLNADMEVINLDILTDAICANPENRCYYCKKRILGAIAAAAHNAGYNEILDGTNASDNADDRPGMKAIREMHILSPLKICGLTKEDIRSLSKDAGLFTWDKPSYSCLATRIRTGEYITASLLARIESAEIEMMKLGFSDFRVRVFHDSAMIQVRRNQIEKVFLLREQILEKLTPLFKKVLFDMEERQ